jgi:Uma2 family endonuclease
MSTAAVPSPPFNTPFARDNLVVAIPPGAHTLAGFRNWYASDDFPEEGRISYLAGEIIVDMSQERLSSHVAIKGEFTRVLITLARERQLGQFLTDGTRVVNETADLSHEPDGCFISRASVDAGSVRFQPGADGKDITEVVGSPDMVLEIVSPSSVRKDKNLLPTLYHKAGIREYWLVDVRRDEIQFDLFRHTPEGYVSAAEVEGWRMSDVFSRQFRIERTTSPVGMTDYLLQSRTA